MPKTAKLSDGEKAIRAELEYEANRDAARATWRCDCGAAKPKHRSTRGRVEYIRCRICGQKGKIVYDPLPNE